jgi:ankyrin repeat protein
MSRDERAPKRLPRRPNLNKLKKDAKALLRAHRSEFSGLRDAQFALARSYGFADWQTLSDAVEVALRRSRTLEEQAELFITDACLRYNGDDRAYRYARAAAMLEQEPKLAFVSLYSALVAGNLEAVRAKLDEGGADLNAPAGPLQRPALLYLTYSRVPAPREDVLAIMRLLLERGADPDSRVLLDGIYPFTAMCGAMGEGERGPVACTPHACADELVALLLDAGASPNEAQGLYKTQFTGSIDKWLELLIARGLTSEHLAWGDHPQKTLDYFLAQAVIEGKYERVRLLVEHGADPSTINGYNGKSCLANAAIRGHDTIAAFLIEHGARKEALGAEDEFRVALRRGEERRMEALLERHPTLRTEPTLLREAAHYGPERVVWLLDRGFDINAQTSDGRTLLMDSALWNYLDGVKFLLDRGADPDIVDKTYGVTALGFALHHRHWPVADFLGPISNNIFDVCRIPELERAKLLLDRDPTLVARRTGMGNTPLHLVSQARDEDIDVETSAAVVDLLLAHGADIEAKNNDGLTPLMWYRKLGIDDMVELLRQRGAGMS